MNEISNQSLRSNRLIHPKVFQAILLAGYNTARKMAPWYANPQNAFNFDNQDTYLLLPGFLASSRHLDILGNEIAKTNNVAYLQDKSYINTSIQTTTKLAIETLKRIFKEMPKNSDIIIVGHSNGGISALKIAELFNKEIKKVVTLSTPLRSHISRKRLHGVPNELYLTNKVFLKGMAYDCHTTILDHVVKYENQKPPEEFLENHPQTMIYNHKESHWPFQQHPKKYCSILINPGN